MSKKTVPVVGTGTIGKPLIGFLSDYKDSLVFADPPISARPVLLYRPRGG